MLKFCIIGIYPRPNESNLLEDEIQKSVLLTAYTLRNMGVESILSIMLRAYSEKFWVIWSSNLSFIMCSEQYWRKDFFEYIKQLKTLKSYCESSFHFRTVLNKGGDILLPKDYVAVSGDIFGGCSWGRGAAGI